MVNFDEIKASMMASLEKKPDIKGTPIKAIVVIPRVELVSGFDKVVIPILRISW